MCVTFLLTHMVPARMSFCLLTPHTIISFNTFAKGSVFVSKIKYVDYS